MPFLPLYRVLFPHRRMAGKPATHGGNWRLVADGLSRKGLCSTTGVFRDQEAPA